jgi:hypothetical protein
MAIRRLERTEWSGFCMHATRFFTGKHAELEVAAVDIGAQVEARRMAFLGIACDPHRHTIAIVLDGLDHLVREPRELYVDHRPEGLASLEIIDGEGRQQIVILHDPLMLPGPAP